MSYFQTRIRSRNARRLLAAALLFVALVDVGSHAVFASHSNGGGSLTWCDVGHYTSPGVDCPHKRERRSPDKGSFDDLGHQAVLIEQLPIEAVEFVFRSELPTGPDAFVLTRPATPPFHPPEQA